MDIKKFLDNIGADYYAPTEKQPAYIYFCDYNVGADPEYLRKQKQVQDTIKETAARVGWSLDIICEGYTRYILIYA